jgi:hypothetical protein
MELGQKALTASARRRFLKPIWRHWTPLDFQDAAVLAFHAINRSINFVGFSAAWR